MLVMLLVLRFVFRKVKNADGQIAVQFKAAFGVWFASLFLAAGVALHRAISVLSDAIDITFRISDDLAIGLLQVSAIFTGLTLALVLLGTTVSKFLLTVFFGKRNTVKEIAENDVGYFILYGAVILGFIISILPIFEILLRMFVPIVSMQFYH
jgi:hypothetical protein